MAGYDIGPRIGIKGEKEFNSQIKAINNSLREYGSELKALNSEFAENENSQDALIAKSRVMEKQLDAQRKKYSLLETEYSKQVQKLRELGEAYQKAAQENGETSVEAGKAERAFNQQAEAVSKLSVAMNETQNYINRLNNSISSNDKMLDQIDKGLRDAVTGYSDLDKAAKGASDSLDDIATGTKAQAFSDLADTISGVGDAMIGIVNDSKEYLQIMGQLEASSQRLGYSAGETEQVYTQLYGVLGDTQTAATATANLQALELSQSDLAQMTELAIGAWAQYGDSIPIDSLAEAINETAQGGKVIGTFADALNWAGISEDEFNEKLQSTNSESERAQMIMDVLASQGLAGVAQKYRDTSAALIESNEAQAKFDEAMSRLAEQIMPIVSEVMSAAADAIVKFVDWFQQLPEPAQNAVKVIGAVIAAITLLSPVIFGIVGAIGALSLALSPVSLIIAVVIAAITAIILIIQNWGAITEWLGGVWETVKSAVSNAVETVRDAISSAWEAIKTKTS